MIRFIDLEKTSVFDDLIVGSGRDQNKKVVGKG